MKRLILIYLLLFLCFMTKLCSDELGDFFPGRIIICFSFELTGNTIGDIKITTENGIISTPFNWFNDLSTEYEIISLDQLYKVKNTEWHRDGKYPMNVFRLETKNHDKTEKLLQELLQHNNILFAELDPVHRQTYTPNDPLLVSQWAIKKIDAEKAWDFETGSDDVIVGIVDSGVKWNHPDLAANIYINEAELPGITINWQTGEILGGDGIDYDGNGFIDDVLGWDFVEGNAANNFEDNNPYQKQYGNEHGTHVAGCAAAVGDNGTGVAGPAYNVKIMVTKHSYTTQATNYIFNGYAGVYYCADSGAHIINCSWGGRGGAEIANLAASYAKDHGALVISAASNDNTDNTYTSYYPSDAIDGLSVAATAFDDTKASFSNYGTPVDVSAPGVSILSTFYGQMGENNYSSLQGTSMASPVAAGVAALILSHYPDLSLDSLVTRLKLGCDPIDHLNAPYLSGKLGAGRVNAFNSLMFDRLPLVSLEFLEIVEVTGDDNTLNPGETLYFKISLKNRENWLDALPSTATIYTENQYVEIFNNTVSYGAIANGETVASDNSFIISVVDNCPIESHIDFKLVYNADAGTGVSMQQEVLFTISVTGNKDKWPLNTQDSPVISTIVFDLNQDDNNEIIFIDSNNTLNVLNILKEPLPGFPVIINGSVNNPLAIVKSGEIYEIVVAGLTSIFKINQYGQITAQFNVSGNISTSVVSYDTDNNGFEEIAVGTTEGLLYLLNNDLTLKPTFPKQLNSSIISLPVFVDFNKDGYLDLLVNTIDRKLHIFTVANGATHWNSPLETNVNVISGLVVAESDEGTYVLSVGSVTGADNIKLINKFGEVRASHRLNSPVTALPIIADLNRSGDLDIICITNPGVVYIFDTDLNVKENFPVSLGGLVTQHPVLADIDNDGNYDIIIPVNNGTIFVIKSDGTIIDGFPYIFNYVWKASPVIADIDGNQKVDILVSNMFNLYYLSLPFSYTESPYPVHAYSRSRNAVFSSNFTSNNDQVVYSKPMNKLIGNYPNPFNPETKISFNIESDYVNQARIDIYNIKGQKLSSLELNHADAKNGFVIWNADRFSSGIYFYKLIVNEKFLDIKKAILLK